MGLAAVLEQSCPILARQWADAADAIYPFAAAGFLRSVADPFANPVGGRSAALAPLLCRCVIGLPHDAAALDAALEEFIRVRAMQDAPPEDSLAVFFTCKGLLRSLLTDRAQTLSSADLEELAVMDKRADEIALRAFGIYVRLRESFFQLQLRDLRRRHSQILRLAKRHGMAEPEEDPMAKAPSPASPPTDSPRETTR